MNSLCWYGNPSSFKNLLMSCQGTQGSHENDIFEETLNRNDIMSSGVSLRFCAGGQWGFSAGNF